MSILRPQPCPSLAAVLVLASLAGTAAAQSQVTMTTVRVASGLASPVFLTSPPGDTARAFIVESAATATSGRIRILNLPGHTLNATPYLTVTPIAAGGEQGLLGLAFHPDFANNGYFYVNYTDTLGDTRIVRYQANAPYATSTTANAASASLVLFVDQPFSNHNAGWLGFGPDGYLYAALGDGGSGNDPGNRAQTITNQLLGKMLRLDVDGPDAYPGDANRNYAIPPTNPFVGATGDDEIWAFGLRNPWRNGFDRGTGDLYIGDVGQNAVEEIDVQPAGAGGLNYGWRCMEGNNCTGLTGCTCNGPTLTAPKHVYTHGSGCSVTGGYVYRGSALCGVQGTYFFSDYCSATLWTFRLVGGAVTQFANRTAELAPGGGLSISSVSSFGEDASGELYICDLGGEVFKVIPRAPTVDCNANSAWDVCDIQNGTSADTNGNGVPDECEFSVTPYCFGDGSGTACPCGNAGASGNGCASSVNANGAHLGSSGTPSVSADSFTLLGTGMPDSFALYFQGTMQQNGGAGQVFGDGLRCAAGTVVRLGTQQNFGGASGYPEIVDPPISTAGGITGGPQTRTYQTWYRNAAAFCTASTFNLTNGLSVVWIN